LVSAFTSRSYRALVLTGCSVDTTSALNVTIDAYPTKPVVTNISGSDSLESSVAGTSYVWRLNGSVISGASSQKYLSAASGVYTVEVGNSSGCKTMSDPFTYLRIGIVENTIAWNANIFPNPTISGKVTVELRNIMSEKADVKVYDMLGKEVMRSTIETNFNMANFEVDLSDNQTGIYFITVKAGNDSITRKVIFNKQ
jgi:hypothetical protein